MTCHTYYLCGKTPSPLTEFESVFFSIIMMYNYLISSTRILAQKHTLLCCKFHKHQPPTCQYPGKSMMDNLRSVKRPLVYSGSTGGLRAESKKKKKRPEDISSKRTLLRWAGANRGGHNRKAMLADDTSRR